MKTRLRMLCTALLLTILMGCAKRPTDDEVLSAAETLQRAFVTAVKADDTLSTADIAETLSHCEVIPFAAVTESIEPGYLNGFDVKIEGFASGTMFAPMIGAIPFVGYVFELPDEAAARAFVPYLSERHNKRWNVCTEADEMVCVSEGNKVFFVMSPTDFDEEA